MKHIFLLAVMAMSKPALLLAHDGNAHVEVPWYETSLLIPLLVAGIAVGVLIVGASYAFPQYRKVLAGLGIASMLVSGVGFQLHQPALPVPDSVVARLSGVPVTVYRTEGCSCCTAFAEELVATGAVVTVETISPARMQEKKSTYGITSEQESCHTSVIDGYVVEGHVPFAAIAQLVTERPAISGITLPGMPIGTPGMPGKQTEVYTVTSLDNELFWQSS